MRIVLIAITRGNPKDWPENMKQGWYEIHHIQTPELKSHDSCLIAESVARQIERTIQDIWQDAEEDNWLRIYAQCNPAIFNFLSGMFSKKHFVYPIFEKSGSTSVFIGWRIYEIPNWQKPMITLSHDLEDIDMPSGVIYDGLARERQGG